MYEPTSNSEESANGGNKLISSSSLCTDFKISKESKDLIDLIPVILK